MSVLHCHGSQHGGAAVSCGVVLVVARRRKDGTCLELVQLGHRAKLVVLAGEVAGRWSEETIAFIRHLAIARARVEPNYHPQEEGGTRMAHEVVFSVRVCRSTRVRGIVARAARPRVI